MESIIKKAIKGGFGRSRWIVNGEEGQYLSIGHERDVVCDPLFWKTLGLWELGARVQLKRKHNPITIHQAMRFHELNLTKGWNKAVEYLQELTK